MLFVRGIIAVVPSIAWKWLAIVGVLGSVYLFIDQRAAHRERAKCEAAAALAQRMADQQDTTAAENAKANDQKIIDAVTQQRDKDDVELKRLSDQLAKRTEVGRCALSEPDARSLRYQ